MGRVLSYILTAHPRAGEKQSHFTFSATLKFNMNDKTTAVARFVAIHNNASNKTRGKDSCITLYGK